MGQGTRTGRGIRRGRRLARAAAALFVVCAACDPPVSRNTVPPDDAAHKWADNLKIPVRGASCTTVDSDGDGYVSCVLAIDRGHDPPPVYQGLQCAELGSVKAGGCKPDSKNPKVDIVEWAVPAPCPTCPTCPPPPTATTTK